MNVVNSIIFWFRRDLRLEDNAGLYFALKKAKESATLQVIPLFIFDKSILAPLVKKNKKDSRVSFIYETVTDLKKQLQQLNSDLLIMHNTPEKAFTQLFKELNISAVYCNRDYEPQAIIRDQKIEKICRKNQADFESFKDQVIFEKNEVMTGQKKPYTVFTPYKNKYLKQLTKKHLMAYPTKKYFKFLGQPQSSLTPMPSLKKLGFEKTQQTFPGKALSKKIIQQYARNRDYPVKKTTSHIGVHLRFGTVSIRQCFVLAQKYSSVWQSELIWRDFFMQILWNFPQVENKSFRPEYENIQWRNNEKQIERWKKGQTGYPLVDAGMRELNATGFMHNRVRMVVASFLAKHLLTHWLIGERYFAEKLLDFDLAANNGNWQWAAGTGCDAAPYFRVFNPTEQQKKFDPDFTYIKKWIPEFGTDRYVKPIVEHTFARDRALREYRKGLSATTKERLVLKS